MKGFIEVTECESGCKLLYAIGKIQAVVSDGQDTFIETGFDRRGESAGAYVRESYEEVKGKIERAS